jgi:hypothetical protein
MDAGVIPALTDDNLHRLINLIILKHDCKISSSEAEEILKGYKLTLTCGPEIAKSKALQAALLTAINTGKRSFLGGIEIIMPGNVSPLVYWPEKQTLNEIVVELGGVLVDEKSGNSSFALLFGNANGNDRSLHVICNGWVGGVSELEVPNPPPVVPDFALGGIVAGALGVAGAFFRVTGLKRYFGSEPMGISLFKPDCHWLVPEATGHELNCLPQKLWVAGLGHLGQAYLWSLGLLVDAKTAKEIEVLLQDFDIVKIANRSTGVLSEERFIGKMKTRVCAEWLERRNIKTKIIEQKFNANTRREGDDPRVALCGFDKAEPRRFLEDAGFDFIVECALGATIDNFDKFLLHTFPNGQVKAKDIWQDGYPTREVDQRLVEVFTKETSEAECGVLVSTLAGKAIATAFVGAIASAFVIAEILRGLHGNERWGTLNVHLRCLTDSSGSTLLSSQNQLAPNGFISLK